MHTVTIHNLRLADIEALAAYEQVRCETLACESEAIDSELADACRFDAGALAACQQILKSLPQDGKVSHAILPIVLTIRGRNHDREQPRHFTFLESERRSFPSSTLALQG